METIFTLFASMILSISVFATDARPKALLTVSSSDQGSIKVVIDGRRFESNDNYVKIQDMDAGYHPIKIYKEKNTGLFFIFGKRYEVVYNSTITIKPFTETDISIDRFGRAIVNESRIRGWYNSSDRGLSADTKDISHDFSYNSGSNYGDYTDGSNSGWSSEQEDSYKGKASNEDVAYYDSRVMSDIEFGRVIKSINKEWFDNNKSKSATQIINTNYLTALQVKQLLQVFSFENTKLDIAKQAYSKTVDKQNYSIVNDAFCFDSSKDELARFIRSCE